MRRRRCMQALPETLQIFILYYSIYPSCINDADDVAPPTAASLAPRVRRAAARVRRRSVGALIVSARLLCFVFFVSFLPRGRPAAARGRRSRPGPRRSLVGLASASDRRPC